MESLGKYLKAERELRNLPIEEVAKFTKIRKDFLTAIEEDRYEFLPSAFYVKGFLTAYARYLGLDTNEVLIRYQNYLKSLTISFSPELQQQVLTQKKRVKPWLFFIVIFGITLFIAFFIYYFSHKHSEWVLSSFEATPSPSIPYPLQGEEKAEIQITRQAVKNDIPKLKEAEIRDPVLPKSPRFKVSEASMGAGIERVGGALVLIGKCSEFTSNNQRVYFFTRIKTPREGRIAHVWLWEGKEFNRIEIEVKPPAWSVYSYITLRPQHAGNWEAQVRDGDRILANLSFKVIESTYDSDQEKL
jgi:transcriptional regulator with XRE-family HTH domain